jgi:hypothetical protein
VDTLNINFCSVDGVLYNKTKTDLIAYPAAKTVSSYSIPASVTNIGDGAFSSCTKLTAVNFPASLNRIGESAFSNCTGLISVTMPDSVNEIDDNAFDYCSQLKTAYFSGNAPATFGASVFQNTARGFTIYY